MSLMRPKQKQPGAAELWNQSRRGEVTREAGREIAQRIASELETRMERKDPESSRYEVMRRERRRYERIARYTEDRT